MLIDETNEEFSSYYEQCRGIEEFATACLAKEVPTLGSIILTSDKKEIIGVSCSTRVASEGSRTWWIPAWAYRRHSSSMTIVNSLEVIGRHPENSSLVSHIMTRHPLYSSLYRGAMIQARKMGFRIIASSDLCDIVQLDV